MEFNNEFSINSNSEEATIKIGNVIGENISIGDIVLLIGDLGAGKTKLTQGIINGLGCSDFVRSPTFVLITEYIADFPIYHMDLYRLDTSESIDRLFLDEYLYGDEFFPHDSLMIKIENISETARKLNFNFNRESFKDLVEKLKGAL